MAVVRKRIGIDATRVPGERLFPPDRGGRFEYSLKLPESVVFAASIKVFTCRPSRQGKARRSLWALEVVDPKRWVMQLEDGCSEEQSSGAG